MRPQVITTSALTDDGNGIAEDQTTSGAADLTLDGALVTSSVATAAEAQIVSIEGSGNNSGITFTVTGTDQDGKTVSEVITGSNGGTAVSTVYFKTVTQIAASGAVTGDVEVGWLAASGFSTKSIPVNWRQSPFNMTVAADLTTSTGTFGVQYTVDGPQEDYTNSFGVDANWRDAAGLDKDSNTADGEDNIITPVRAVRGIATIGTSTTVLKFTFIQGQNG